MKKIKSIIMLALILSISAMQGYAQEAGKSADRNMQHKMDPVKASDDMRELLNLSDQQYVEVLEINKRFAEQKQAMKEERKEDRMKTAVERRELMEARNAALKEVLDEKQFKTLNEHQQARKEKMKENRKRK